MKIGISIKNEQGVLLPSTLVIKGGGGNGNFESAYPALTFTLDSDIMPGIQEPDTVVIASSPGYQSLAVTGNALQVDNDFILLKKKSILPAVLVGGGLIGAVWFITSRQKKKIAGVDLKNDVLPWVLPVGVIVGGVLVYNKFFGDTAEQKQYKESIDAGIKVADQQQPPILTDAQIAVMADTLSNDISGFTSDTNVPDILTQFMRINNTAELLRLIKAYGTRWAFFLGIPRGKYNLQESLHLYLDADTINLINSYLTNAGISFQF